MLTSLIRSQLFNNKIGGSVPTELGNMMVRTRQIATHARSNTRTARLVRLRVWRLLDAAALTD